MNFFKKQGVAWVITAVMIVIAICIGLGKSDPYTDPPKPTQGPGYVDTPTAVIPTEEGYCVLDYAGVLSRGEIESLSKVNRKLADDMDVVVACVTTNHGGDLYEYALKCADEMELKENDFIVVLDISGQNYWLVQGEGLIGLFSDQDCSDYAWEYMEKYFAQGDYGSALLKLQDALSDWYYDHW